MEIVLATKNKKKIEEIRRILYNLLRFPLEKEGFGSESPPLKIFTLDDFSECPDVIEDGETFEANAIKKALSVAKYTGMPSLADDSGLEVYALNGAPGISSARYAGKDADDTKNLEKLLYEMRSIADERRDARFVCCIALAYPDGRVNTFYGYVKGKIGRQPRGESGFGYDPVFYPDGFNKTFAEMTPEEKDSISHRGKALKRLYWYLKGIYKKN